MSWLGTVQIVLTSATALVAAFVGYQQHRLDERIRTQEADLKARIDTLHAEIAERAEARLDREQRRRFEFDVFGVVLDSLKEDDPQLQRALVAYFTALDGTDSGEFGRSMLVLFRSRSTDPIAAKEAGEFLGREVETAQVRFAEAEQRPAPITEPAADKPFEGELPFGTVHVGEKSGWDYDLFVCDDSLAKDPSATSSEVGTTLEALEAFDPERGRVRLRQLSEAVRAKDQQLRGSGLFMIVDPVRRKSRRRPTWFASSAMPAWSSNSAPIQPLPRPGTSACSSALVDARMSFAGGEPSKGDAWRPLGLERYQLSRPLPLAGSRASRRPSPMKWKQNRVSARKASGKISIQG